jgi:hypothetical protein
MNRLSIGLFNTRGISSSIDELIREAEASGIDVLVVTETMLLPPTRIPTHWTQHHLYGTSREGTFRGFGGISILIRPNFPFHIYAPTPTQSLYQYPFRIGPYTFYALYLPPSLSPVEIHQILVNIPLTPLTMVLGDFNARLGDAVGDSRDNSRGRMTLEWQEDSSLYLWNAELAWGKPTYLSNMGSSIIDLVFSNFLPAQRTMYIKSELSLSSDHKLVIISFDIQGMPTPLQPQPRHQWRLQRLQDPDILDLYIKTLQREIQQYSQLIQDALQSNSMTPQLIETLSESLVQAIYKALDMTVGAREPRPKHWKWFWNQDLQDRATQRQLLYTRWHQATIETKATKWQAYSKADQDLYAAIKKARRQAYKVFCQQMDDSPTLAMRTIKRITKSQHCSPSFSCPEGPAHATGIMVDHLASVVGGNRPSTTLPTLLYATDEPPPFSKAQLKTLIKTLPRQKAPGSDFVTAEMLFPVAEILANPLYDLFSLCWKWSYTPHSWRLAQVVPIYKKGDSTDPANYRPISLTSTFRKLLEKCLMPTLLATMPPLDIAQGGFRAQRSALDQALALHELIQLHYHRYQAFPTLAFLDIKAAYDSVDRQVIWNTLRSPDNPTRHQTVSQAMVDMLKNLFNDVSMEVLLQGQVSHRIFPATGVLQGSILSPVLYSVFINSLPQALREACNTGCTLPNGTTVNSLLYADDVALIARPQDMLALLIACQNHSDYLGYRWSPSKCVIVNSSPHTTYQMYDTNIPAQSLFLYLGIPFAKTGIDPKAMASRLGQKAYTSMVGLGKVGVNPTGFNRHTCVSLYKAFVRPKMEYGLAITVFSNTHVAALQKAQDNSLRQIFGGYKSSSTQVMHVLANLPSMASRITSLGAKYLVRALSLPRDSMIAQVIPITEACKRPGFWKRLQLNPIWTTISQTMAPGALRNPKVVTMALKKAIYDYQLTLFREKQALYRSVAPCRPSLAVDPILYLPATPLERSRLIRWRLQWLPGGQPKPCPCGQGLLTRTHTRVCPSLLPTPQCPPFWTHHPIDYYLNQLPARLPKTPREGLYRYWADIWPSILTFLHSLDQLSHHEIPFEDEPPPGKLFIEAITPLPSLLSVEATTPPPDLLFVEAITPLSSLLPMEATTPSSGLLFEEATTSSPSLLSVEATTPSLGLPSTFRTVGIQGQRETPNDDIITGTHHRSTQTQTSPEVLCPSQTPQMTTLVIPATHPGPIVLIPPNTSSNMPPNMPPNTSPNMPPNTSSDSYVTPDGEAEGFLDPYTTLYHLPQANIPWPPLMGTKLWTARIADPYAKARLSLPLYQWVQGDNLVSLSEARTPCHPPGELLCPHCSSNKALQCAHRCNICLTSPPIHPSSWDSSATLFCCSHYPLDITRQGNYRPIPSYNLPAAIKPFFGVDFGKRFLPLTLQTIHDELVEALLAPGRCTPLELVTLWEQTASTGIFGTDIRAIQKGWSIAHSPDAPPHDPSIQYLYLHFGLHQRKGFRTHLGKVVVTPCSIPTGAIDLSWPQLASIQPHSDYLDIEQRWQPIPRMPTPPPRASTPLPPVSESPSVSEPLSEPPVGTPPIMARPSDASPAEPIRRSKRRRLPNPLTLLEEPTRTHQDPLQTLPQTLPQAQPQALPPSVPSSMAPIGPFYLSPSTAMLLQGLATGIAPAQALPGVYENAITQQVSQIIPEITLLGMGTIAGSLLFSRTPRTPGEPTLLITAIPPPSSSPTTGPPPTTDSTMSLTSSNTIGRHKEL